MKFSYQVLVAALGQIEALEDALAKANARIKELEATGNGQAPQTKE